MPTSVAFLGRVTVTFDFRDVRWKQNLVTSQKRTIWPKNWDGPFVKRHYHVVILRGLISPNFVKPCTKLICHGVVIMASTLGIIRVKVDNARTTVFESPLCIISDILSS
jgi:hypothetical protein